MICSRSARRARDEADAWPRFRTRSVAPVPRLARLPVILDSLSARGVFTLRERNGLHGRMSGTIPDSVSAQR